jgi:hypothetical protein
MEYLYHRGTYMDVPFEDIVSDFREHYPALLARAGLTGDFQTEAVSGGEGDIGRPSCPG